MIAMQVHLGVVEFLLFFLQAKKKQKTLARINSLGRGLRFPFQFII